MARATKPAAEKAAENAAEASEDETQSTTGETAENAAVVDSGANSSTSDTTEPDSEFVEVVVLPKRTLRHEGKKHKPHAKVSVPASEVSRLVRLGFVTPYAVVRAAALSEAGAVVTVNDGVRIQQG